MADVVPQTIEKSPTANVSVSKPASGTYGEKANLERLKASLPASGAATMPPGPGGSMPTPQTGGLPNPQGRPANSSMPSGVPGALGHPTDRPGVPLGTKLQPQQGSPIAEAESARDARIALLMALSQSPEVSDTTREWAQMVLEMLNGN